MPEAASNAGAGGGVSADKNKKQSPMEPKKSTSICPVQGCRRKTFSNGVCSTHYKKFQQLVETKGEVKNIMETTMEKMGRTECPIRWCERKRWPNRLCSTCSKKFRQNKEENKEKEEERMKRMKAIEEEEKNGKRRKWRGPSKYIQPVYTCPVSGCNRQRSLPSNMCSLHDEEYMQHEDMEVEEWETIDGSLEDAQFEASDGSEGDDDNEDVIELPTQKEGGDQADKELDPNRKVASNLDDVPFDELEQVYIRRKHQNKMAVLETVSFDLLQQMYHKRKRLKTTIDLTSGNTATIQPDDSGASLRIQVKQQQALITVKSENADQAAEIEDGRKRAAAHELGLERMTECVICQDMDKCIALFPCSHLALCEPCQHSVEECPICREKIEEKRLVKMV